MSLLRQIIPSLAESASEIKTEMELFLASLPDYAARDFFNSLEMERNREPEDTSLIRWMLHYSFLYSGFFQARVLLNGRIVFTFGAGFEAAGVGDSNDALGSLPESVVARLRFVSREAHRGRHALLIEGYAPLATAEWAEKLCEKEIIALASGYFFHLPDLRDRRLADYLSIAEERFVEVSGRELDAGSMLAVSHFHFQDMKVYFELSGESKAFEIIEEIKEIIRERLSEKDRMFVISPTSYLVLSPGISEAEAAVRFQSMYFQVHTLILDYDLNICDITGHPIRTAEIWKRLGI